MTDYETVIYEEIDGVAWVTLNRPEVYNAFNAQMAHELQHIWRSLRSNDNVRVAVLTGAGDMAFCTGLDRSEQISDDADPALREVGTISTPFHFDDPGAYICPKRNDLWKPVIAGVNGIACAGAFHLLGESDFIIAADHATFFDPHVTYGMTAAYEPIYMLQKMPFHEIMRLSLLGSHERLSAKRAFDIGLVTEIVTGPELRGALAWAAGAIASAPGLAIEGTVRALWTGLELSRSQALGLSYAYVGLGTNWDSIRQGEKDFSSGKRVEWRLR